MEIEDIILRDVSGFFTSLNSNNDDKLLKENNSIIPYLAFVILINDKAYDYIIKKMNSWNKNRIFHEYDRCPWIRSEFVTRIKDFEKQKRIISILLYLCSDETTDDEIYEILSVGWKRIGLYVNNRDVIDLKQAPLRKRIEEKWVLCFMSFIKHKIIIQAQYNDEWYKTSTEMFFYFEFIIQRLDIDPFYTKDHYAFSLNDQTVQYIEIDDNTENQIDNPLSIQLLFLLKERERIIRNSLCDLEIKESTDSLSPISNKIKSESQTIQEETDLSLFYKRVQHYEKRMGEIEKQNRELSAENIKLKTELELLNEEISLLRTSDEENIILEDECDWDYIYSKKLVICGGRTEWLSRIKQLFPQWKYIENDNIRFDGAILKDSSIDAIVFNKRFVSHGLFYRVASQKANSIPLIHISSSNVEFALQTICNRLKMMPLEQQNE